MLPTRSAALLRAGCAIRRGLRAAPSGQRRPWTCTAAMCRRAFNSTEGSGIGDRPPPPVTFFTGAGDFQFDNGDGDTGGGGGGRAGADEDDHRSDGGRTRDGRPTKGGGGGSDDSGDVGGRGASPHAGATPAAGRPRLAALRERLRSQSVPKLQAARATKTNSAAGSNASGRPALGRMYDGYVRRALAPDYQVNHSPTALQARSLYRQILRAAAAMPTANRRDFIRARARREYDLAVGEEDPDKVAFHLRYAETQLESIHVQAEHLAELDKMQAVW